MFMAFCCIIRKYGTLGVLQKEVCVMLMAYEIDRNNEPLAANMDANIPDPIGRIATLIAGEEEPSEKLIGLLDYRRALGELKDLPSTESIKELADLLDPVNRSQVFTPGVVNQFNDDARPRFCGIATDGKRISGFFANYEEKMRYIDYNYLMPTFRHLAILLEGAELDGPPEEIAAIKRLKDLTKTVLKSR